MRQLDDRKYDTVIAFAADYIFMQNISIIDVKKSIESGRHINSSSSSNDGNDGIIESGISSTLINNPAATATTTCYTTATMNDTDAYTKRYTYTNAFYMCPPAVLVNVLSRYTEWEIYHNEIQNDYQQSVQAAFDYYNITRLVTDMPLFVASSAVQVTPPPGLNHTVEVESAVGESNNKFAFIDIPVLLKLDAGQYGPENLIYFQENAYDRRIEYKVTTFCQNYVIPVGFCNLLRQEIQKIKAHST